MKQKGGFSFLGIFYGLLISIGGPMLVGAIYGGILGFQYGQQGIAPDQVEPLIIQAFQREPVVIIFAFFSLLFLLLGSFIAANAAGSSAGMAFVHSSVVALVNFLLSLPPIWRSLDIPHDTGVSDLYFWVGALAVWPVALLGAVLSVLTAEKPVPAPSSYRSPAGQDYPFYH